MNYTEANIPARLHGLDWGDFEGSRATDAVQSWAKSFPERWLMPTADPKRVGHGLLLHGGQGAGKTTSASLLLKHVIDTGKAGWFVPVQTLENMLHRSMDISTYMRKTDVVEPEVLERFEQLDSRLAKIRMRYYVLVLDDWGRERMASTFVQDYVEGLVRERFNRGLPTIITTNLDLDEIKATLAPPFVSFLNEACTNVDFGRKDFRRGAG